jgi:glycosyltransferase 2 family protein
VKKYLILLLKFVLSIGLLLYLFHKVDFHKLTDAVRHSDWRFLILCILLYGLGQVLSTYKWSLLIHSHGTTHLFRNLVSYYYIGMFFNLFMPSIVGGDIQRCYAVYRDEKLNSGRPLAKGRLSQIISSVMMERATGLIAMIGLANIAYFFFFKNVPNEDLFLSSYLPKVLLLLLVGTVAGFVFLLFIRLPEQESVEHTRVFARVIHSLKNITIQFKSYVQNPRLLFQVMIISFIFQTKMIIINALLGYSLGLSVPLGYYFIIVPLITICTALPISFSGLGVREAAYVYFLRYAGVNSAYAILLSLSVVFIIAVNALMGGLILFKRGFFIEKATVQEN